MQRRIDRRLVSCSRLISPAGSSLHLPASRFLHLPARSTDVQLHEASSRSSDSHERIELAPSKQEMSDESKGVT